VPLRDRARSTVSASDGAPIPVLPDVGSVAYEIVAQGGALRHDRESDKASTAYLSRQTCVSCRVSSGWRRVPPHGGRCPNRVTRSPAIPRDSPRFGMALRFRKPTLYPLSYGGFRSSVLAAIGGSGSRGPQPDRPFASAGRYGTRSQDAEVYVRSRGLTRRHGRFLDRWQPEEAWSQE
jgi:hypothetical protein